MRLKKLFILSTVALLGATPSMSTAQTWETVLDYQLAAGKESDGSGIVADAFGNVFSGGDGYDASGVSHGPVLMTDTTQLANTDPNPINWYFSDDTNPSATQYQSVIWNMGLDASNNVYSIGQLTPNSTGVPYWYVRKSADSGVSWSTVDLYQYTPGQMVDPTGFAADDQGNIYVAGWGHERTVIGSGKHTTTNSYIHWLVRKSSDAGKTWALVDDAILADSSGHACIPSRAAFVPNVGIFVVGTHFLIRGSWIVRRSASGQPGTWSTVDGPFVQGAAQAVCSDNQGNIHVSGSMFVVTGVVTIKHQTTTNGYYAWITRKSSNGGNTWTNVDDYTYAPNQSAHAYGSGTDSAGNVVVVGNAGDALGGGHWIGTDPGPVGLANGR